MHRGLGLVKLSVNDTQVSYCCCKHAVMLTHQSARYRWLHKQPVVGTTSSASRWNRTSERNATKERNINSQYNKPICNTSPSSSSSSFYSFKQQWDIRR